MCIDEDLRDVSEYYHINLREFPSSPGVVMNFRLKSECLKLLPLIATGLLKNQNLSDGAYDWLRVLKYHMDIRTVLRAKTEADESDVNSKAKKRPILGELVSHLGYAISCCACSGTSLVCL